MALEKISYQKLKETKTEINDKIGELSSLSTTNKTSLVNAINETFTSVSNGKSLIASAITDKGVPTESDATFQTMATNISNIPSGGTPTPPSNYRSGTFTLSDDTYESTKVSNLDADVLNHINDSTFLLGIYANFIPIAGSSFGGIKGNTSYVSDKTGNGLYLTSSTIGSQLKTTSVSTVPTETLSNFWVASDGLYINSSTSYKWRAGTYSYFCSW